METVRYGDFSLAINRRVSAQRIPVTGTIEVTRRCPLECAHCYNNLPMDDREARSSELTYEEHCRILDELSEAGCLWLLLTGGEIFARRDFLDIYTYAKRKGFLITLFTNGTMITPRIADCLAEWRPFSIEVTLYGGSREVYERLTGIPGSYDRCLQGIDLLMERGLPLKLKSVALTINKHELGDMKRLAESRGLEFKFDAMMNPRIDCSRSPLEVRLTPEEVVALDLEDPKRIEEWKQFAARFNGPVHKSERNGEVYHCGGGVSSFAIDPQGRMSICVLSHFDTYDLRRGSFREGWDDFLFKVRAKKTTLLTKCVDCQIKAVCGMCPANGELENGHAEKPVDFLCQVAHLRAQVMGFPARPHGECEYCEGGSGYQDLMHSVTALENPEIRAVLANARGRALPVMSSGGCNSCSSCSTH